MTRINETHLGWWMPGMDPMHWHDDSPSSKCIPVFAPLPTPIESTETREDMERHAEVVVYAGGYTGEAVFRLPPCQGRCVVMSAGDVATEADAVLYVVEGKLP